MTTTVRRRIISAAYRILDNRDEPQARAIDRLTTLTDFSVALSVWLQTKPDPALVEAIINYHLLQNAMRNIHVGRAWKTALDFSEGITSLQTSAGQSSENIAALSGNILKLAEGK